MKTNHFLAKNGVINDFSSDPVFNPSMKRTNTARETLMGLSSDVLSSSVT